MATVFEKMAELQAQRDAYAERGNNLVVKALDGHFKALEKVHTAVGSLLTAVQNQQQANGTARHVGEASDVKEAIRLMLSAKIDENKKAELRVYVQNMANKEQLINETWGCVQAVEPTDMMGLQNCFVPWAQRKGEELRNYIMSNFQSY